MLGTVPGDFTGSGQRKWSTLMFFQTGTGDTTGNDRKPAVYGMDISDPANPVVIFEYSMADVAVRGSFELGVGLTLAAGRVQTGITAKTMVFVQTNNGGSGSVTNVAFLNPDGSLDTSFNHTGVTTTNFANGDNQAHDIAVQVDGKIIVGGQVSVIGTGFFDSAGTVKLA